MMQIPVVAPSRKQATLPVEVFAVMFCLIDKRMTYAETLKALQRIGITSRKAKRWPDKTMLAWFWKKKACPDPSFVEAWGWPALEKRETVLSRMLGETTPKGEQKVPRRILRSMIADDLLHALMRLPDHPKRKPYANCKGISSVLYQPRATTNDKFSWNIKRAKALKILRSRRGWSQEDLVHRAKTQEGKRVQVDRSLVSKLESESSPPGWVTEKTIRAFMCGMNLTLEDLDKIEDLQQNLPLDDDIEWDNLDQEPEEPSKPQAKERVVKEVVVKEGRPEKRVMELVLEDGWSLDKTISDLIRKAIDDGMHVKINGRRVCAEGGIGGLLILL